MKRWVLGLTITLLALTLPLGSQQPQTDEQRQRILDRSVPPMAPTAVSPVVGATNVPLTLNEIRYEALNGSRCEVYLNTVNQFPTSVRFYNGPCTGVASIPVAFTSQIQPNLRVFAHVKSFNTFRGNNPSTFTWSFTFGAASCTPVNCEWNDWILGTPTAWSACSGGSQTRTRTDTRTVKTPASCGGAACAGDSTRTVTETQACGTSPGTFSLSVAPTTLAEKASTPLVVTWANIPSPTTGDWLAVYTLTEPPHHFTYGELWMYVDCSQRATGIMAIPSGSCGFNVSGLAPNRYRVSLNANESLTEIARVEFTITTAPSNCVYSVPVFKSALTACVSGSRDELWTSTLVSGDTTCAKTQDITQTNRPCTVTQERSVFSNEVTQTPVAGVNTAVIQWDEPTSGAPTFYEVYRGTASGAYGPPVVSTVQIYSFPVTPGTPFFAAVKAVKETDVATPISVALTVQPSTASSPPPLPPSPLEQDVKATRTAIMETMIKDYEQGIAIIDSVIKQICRRVGPTGQLQCLEASQLVIK